MASVLNGRESQGKPTPSTVPLYSSKAVMPSESRIDVSQSDLASSSRAALMLPANRARCSAV